MREMIIAMGPMFWLILFFATLALAVLAERLFYFHRININSGEFLRGLSALLRSGQYDECLHEARQLPGPMARVVEAVLSRPRLSRHELREIALEASEVEVYRIERNVRTLLVCATVMPLLGVLGTLLALVSFYEQPGVTDGAAAAPVVAATLQQALLLSAAGTIGAGAVAPAVSEALGGHRKNVIVNLLVTSLCASVCTMPVGALCFDGISIVAAFTTVLVQPFFILLITLVPVALLFSFVSQPVMLIAGFCADAIAAISSFVGGFDFSYITLDGRTAVLFILLLISGAVITVCLSHRIKPVIVFAAVSVLAFVASQALYGIISYNDIKINILADSMDTILCVSDKTGKSFYMLRADGSAADKIYEYSSGHNANFICICSETGNLGELSSLCNNLHTPENGNMVYDISGEYTATITDGGIILDIRGVTVGLLPADSETACDILVCCGYKKDYGCKGNSATILCDKKYYNCGDAVNAFLVKTEIIINSEGMYALCTE